jgi:hypothetical protein
LAWEQYTLENRFQIDQAYEQDLYFRTKQDADFGNTENPEGRMLGSAKDWISSVENGIVSHTEQIIDEEESDTTRKETVLDDGTGYHPKIWSSGAIDPSGDEPEGSGPFLPLWQRR